jgi:hypothetical protein
VRACCGLLTLLNMLRKLFSHRLFVCPWLVTLTELRVGLNRPERSRECMSRPVTLLLLLLHCALFRSG